MSEILDGVLRMPPELWDNGPVDVAQRHSRYVQAADRIAELEAVLDEVHSWAICAPIATDTDMMKNIGRIIEITDTDNKKRHCPCDGRMG